MWGRNAVVVQHVGIATRTVGFGVATTSVNVGEFSSGQLHVRIAGLGTGGKLKVWWMSSPDNVGFAILASIATLAATGCFLVGCPPGAGPGQWARARWSVATSVKFGMSFVLQS